MLTQSTGLAPSAGNQAMLNEPAIVDSRWKVGGDAMLVALRDILSSGIDPDELSNANLSNIDTHEGSACRRDTRTAQARAVPIIPGGHPVRYFRGAKMQFFEGCPGAAKTYLVVCMALWMYTFTDLNMIVTNQQNTSNKVFQETVLKFADEDSEWLKEVHVLVSDSA
eukprot:3776005-Heterocapsa_arctica.AAC.1